ncbi:hypothetical protein [Bacillus phage BC-T25]|nr:hypothetical protein [Bacillus phage BC-T25]
METYLVTASGSDMKDVRYVGTDIEAAKASADSHETPVYLYVWNGGILIRKYLRISKNHGSLVRWKLINDYLRDMKTQLAFLENKLGKVVEVGTSDPIHKDDGEGGWYLA